jgi:heme exporter protein CcmD
MPDWLNMGGYWAYLWPAYAIALAGLAAILVPALRAHGAAMKAQGRAARDDKTR